MMRIKLASVAVAMLLTITITTDLLSLKADASTSHLHSHEQLQPLDTHQTQQQQQQQSGGRIIPSGSQMVPSDELHNIGRPARHLAHNTEEKETKTRFVDLSHPLHNGTLHWPQFGDFQYTILADGERKDTQGEKYYVKADSISTALHLGTHLDAPRHFARNSWTVEQIPLERLIDVPLTVIDLSEKVTANRSYNFQKADFLDAKTGEPLVHSKSVVLVYTGISQLYDQGEKAYLGTDTRNISEMLIPGFSGEAAQLLVEQGVYGVGLDSASADSSERHGVNQSYHPVAHVLFNSNNIYILENVSGKLRELVGVAPAGSNTRITIAPLPIVGGSGSPVRLVAQIAHDQCYCDMNQTNAGGQLQQHSSVSFVVILILCLLAFVI